MKVNLLKFDDEMIGSYVHTGGIATATVLSSTYLDEWGSTCIDVMWDNDWQQRVYPIPVMFCAIRKPGKDPMLHHMLKIYELS